MAIHVLISANEAWNIYNFRRGLVDFLLQRGDRVTILAPGDEFSATLRAMGCHVIDLPIASQGANPIFDTVLLCRFVWNYLRHRPDIVLNYTIKPNIYGSLATRIVNIPSIAITTGLGYTFINDGLVARLARHMYKISLRFAKQVWFLNTDDKEVFLRHNLVPAASAYVLSGGEGLDVTAFSPRPYAADDRKFRFLLIGRMLWDKGVGEYVEAAKLLQQKYPHVTFQLLGGTGAANPTAISDDMLRDWQSSGYVEYLGTTGDVRPLIAAADCVVLPSYREGVPRTLMEAASMARPIIATDVPGCRDVVEDGVNGFLCLPRNVADLTAKMEKMLLLSLSERHDMGLRGRAKALAEFDEQVVINTYVDRIGSILGAPCVA